MKSLIIFLLGMCGVPSAQRADCEARCATIASCGDEWATQSCNNDCWLHTTDPEVATCIVDAGCTTIRKRLAMDLDIVGLCQAEARRN